MKPFDEARLEHDADRLEEELLEWMVEKTLQKERPEAIEAALQAAGALAGRAGADRLLVGEVQKRMRTLQERGFTVLAS